MINNISENINKISNIPTHYNYLYLQNNFDYNNNNINFYNTNSNYNTNNYNQINSSDIYPKNNNIIEIKEKKPCGIVNYKNNCYLNSGLQILVSCDKLVEELKNYINIKNDLINLINDAFHKLLNENIYDSFNFTKYFCKLNDKIFGIQYCSQNFIRTILSNINNELINFGDKHAIYENSEYFQNIKNSQDKQIEFHKFIKFIESNNYFIESKAIKLFSGLSKFFSFGKCLCGEMIIDYSFNYFIDQNLYLDNIPDNCSFSKLLLLNLGDTINITSNCPKCGAEICLKEETKLIKIPEIFIFTLERYKNCINNNISIIPEETIDITNYLDDSVKAKDKKYEYELFGINIRLGNTIDFGHEICQVKRNNIWYEMNDTLTYKRTRTYNNNSYGLFYKRKNNI